MGFSTSTLLTFAAYIEVMPNIGLWALRSIKNFSDYGLDGHR